MKAVLLANMGAPISEENMKIFLKKMFNDKAIIYAPRIVRAVLSTVISTLRYKSSWQKYLLIGGSPLQQSMLKTAEHLQQLLGTEYSVNSVFSYSEPFIEEKIIELYLSGIKDFTVISMYPQASYSTTGSVQASLDKIQQQYADIKFRFTEDYFNNEQFLHYWTYLIKHKIEIMGYKNPHLLFSSHAIPQSFLKRGDKYAEKMESSARLISQSLTLPYSLSYQSKIGPTEWTRPYTIDQLRDLRNKRIDEIVVIPLSFINENLETKYDLDIELIPFAIKELGIKNICRVVIPESDEVIIQMFYNFITRQV